MRVKSGILLLSSVAGIAIVLVIGSLILSPPFPLIADAGFDRAAISPDADGENDLAIFEYSLSRPATVDFSLTSENGEKSTIFAKAKRAATTNTAFCLVA